MLCRNDPSGAHPCTSSSTDAAAESMGSGESCSGSHVARRAERAKRGTSAGKNTKDVQCRRLLMCLGHTESVLSTISTAVSTPSRTSRLLCSLSELSHCTKQT